MKTGRGKRVALVTVGIGLVVAIATGFALKDRIQEEWWIYKLEHGDEDEKCVAAERLGEARCARAVGPLIEEMRRLAPEIQRSTSMTSLRGGFESAARRQQAEGWERNWPGRALSEIGAPSLQPLFDLMVESERFQWTPQSGRSTQGAGGPSPVAGFDSCCWATFLAIGSEGRPLLEVACLDPDDDVRVVACPLLRVLRERQAAGVGASTEYLLPPRIDAVVEQVNASGDRVVIDKGEDSGLDIGYLLAVVRGKEAIGKIQVVRASRERSEARVLIFRPGGRVEVGDATTTRVGFDEVLMER